MRTDPVLVILIPGFPANAHDSTCLPAQQRFIKAVNTYFPRLRIVILSFQYPYHACTYEWEGNRVIAFGGRNKGGFQRRLLWRRVANTLDLLNRENNIVGVLGFWAGECALVGKRWAEKTQKKFYCWIMGQDARADNSYISRSNMQDEALIAISDAVASEIKTNHHLDVAHTIPIGIDACWLRASQVKKDIAVCCAGSLIPLKQYHLCIPFMEVLTREFPSARMIIAGKGPEEEKLQDLIRENHQEHNILLAGEKNYGETLELMSRCRIFLHPSSSEGFSMACLEALGSGAEVISFHQPMNRSLHKWHIVKTIEEMSETAVRILHQLPDTAPQFPYPLEQTVSDVMELFGMYAQENVVQPLRCSVG